jgi:hypothetical protein
MPTTPSSQDVTLRTLRAIIDAGGPQRPVTSGPRVTATIGRPSGLERPLPMGDEFLARVRTIGDLLNELGLSPLENANPGPVAAGGLPLKLGGAMKTIPIGKAAESASAITQSATAGKDLASRIRPLVGFDKYNVENVLDAIQTGNPRNVESALLRGGLSPTAILRLDPMTIQPLPMQMSPAAYARADAAGYPLRIFHGSRNPNLTKLPQAVTKNPAYDFGFHAASEPATSNRFISGPALGNLEEGSTIYPLVARVPESRIIDMPDLGLWRSPLSWEPRKFALDERLTTLLDAPQTKPNELAVLQQLQRDAGRQMRSRPGAPAEGSPHLLWQQHMKDLLGEAGFDAIRYPNTIEGLGDPSYLFLRPEQVRSPFAKFDPAKRNVNDILASFLGAVAAGSMAARAPDEKVR